MNNKKICILSIVIVALFLGTWTYTRAVGSQITVCVKKSGLIYVIGEDFKRTDCKKNDSLLSWNSEGVQGPKGDRGDQGDTGPMGPQGPKGDKGDAGEQGPVGESGWDENRISGLEARILKIETKCQTKFNDNNDGTVTDNCTELIWQKVPPNIHLNWDEAQDYCNDLTLANKGDWRFPSANELATIIDYDYAKPASDPVFVFQPDFYSVWSSTISKNNNGMLLADFRFGIINGSHSGNGALVRCVI